MATKKKAAAKKAAARSGRPSMETLPPPFQLGTWVNIPTLQLAVAAGNVAVSQALIDGKTLAFTMHLAEGAEFTEEMRAQIAALATFLADSADLSSAVYVSCCP